MWTLSSVTGSHQYCFTVLYCTTVWSVPTHSTILVFFARSSCSNCPLLYSIYIPPSIYRFCPSPIDVVLFLFFSLASWWVCFTPSFSVKKCPVIFFHKQGNKASNMLLKVTPPPIAYNTYAQSFGSQGSKSYVWRRTGRGEDFCTILSIFFCLHEKNNTAGTFLHTKIVNMANFRLRLLSNLENHYEIVGAGLPRAIQIIVCSDSAPHSTPRIEMVFNFLNNFLLLPFCLCLFTCAG